LKVLENKDYKEIIQLYDSDHTLFYLDPPNPSTDEVSGRESYYQYTFTLADLHFMARYLRNIKGYWVLKSYEDIYPLIKDELPQHNVYKFKKTRLFEKLESEKRKLIEYVIAYNFETPSLKQDNLRVWI